VGPRAGLERCGKSRPPTGIRSPDCPARSHSLYRLRYPAHVTRGRYCNIYKIPSSEMVWSCGKNAKSTSAKTNYDSEDGRSKEKRKALYSMDGRERRDLNIVGIKTGWHWSRTNINGGWLCWRSRPTTERNA